MKFLFSALALVFGALAFQSCEVYPNGTSRGYNHDDGYYGGRDVVVSSGYSEHHGDGYNNGYYGGERAHADRNVQTNRNVNVNVNRHAQVNQNVHVNQKAHGNPNVQAKPNTHGKPKVHSNPNTDVRKQ